MENITVKGTSLDILTRDEWVAWLDAQSQGMQAVIECLCLRLVDREGYSMPVACNAVYNMVQTREREAFALAGTRGPVH